MKSLRIVIIEDEAATARELAHIIRVIDPQLSVVATLQSVSDSVGWFEENTSQYDLIFMDIRLTDGLSFDIFKQTGISKPVIFVTAYHDYAIQAFKNNGIDYILKPFDEGEIGNALKKYDSLFWGDQSFHVTAEVERMLEQLSELTKPYKKSFLVHFREKLIPVETSKIAWFYTAHDLVFAMTREGQQYLLEFTMEQLIHQLDPVQFFRANRQYILHRHMIGEIQFYFNGRLSVKVKPEPPSAILISKARAPEFRAWMSR
jgi:DNA-binding LytR/AlgR family response regulator